MTRNEFMYITGIENDVELNNIMLLSDDHEPENGDYTELMKKWYEDLRQYANNYEQKYVQLIKDCRNMRNKHC